MKLHGVKWVAKACFKRLTGLKWARVAEWRHVIADEAGTAGWLAVALDLARGCLGLGGVSRARWRQRLRACPKCPCYVRATHRCGGRPLPGLGCGCWMPAKAFIRKGACWVRGLGEQKYGFE